MVGMRGKVCNSEKKGNQEEEEDEEEVREEKKKVLWDRNEEKVEVSFFVGAPPPFPLPLTAPAPLSSVGWERLGRETELGARSMRWAGG